jgi:hypothetical protein
MDFYVIPPLANKTLMHSGDRYFCLAQLYLSDKEYKAFFRSLPDSAWITLDNGAGDHDLVTEDQLFEVMKELMPDEVIPPDVLFYCDITVENAILFQRRMKIEELDDKIEIFFCPQGKDQDEWLACYKWGIDQDWITTIGLSKIAVPQAFLGVKGDVGIMESRHNCFNYLKVHGMLTKPLHLLGMGDPREFDYYQKHDTDEMVRSSDSCNSVWSAMNGKDWTHVDSSTRFERIPTPKDYFNRPPLSSKELSVAENNIDFLKEQVQ